jgi:hypothetical protein
MRRTSFFAIAVAIVSAAQFSHGQEPTRIKNIDHLVFEGLQSFDVKELRDTLSRDVDVVAAERSHVAPESFLKAVERTLTLGYQHSGFRDVSVNASYEQDGNRTVVRIQEGQRQLCGEVKIVGCQRIKPDAIVACITEAVDPDEILWPIGRNVPYDETTHRAIRERLQQAFCAAGFCNTKFDIEIKVEIDAKRAALIVNIRDEGPPARIGQITVEGAKRDGAAEVLRYLSISHGQPFDSLLPTRIEEKLDQSGRFVISEVVANPDPKNSDKEHDHFDLTIRLLELEHAPRLDQQFSDKEQAILKMADWAGRWSAGQVPEDLVIELASSAEEIAAGMGIEQEVGNWSRIEKIAFKTIVSPLKGTAIILRTTDTKGKSLHEIAFSTDRDRILLGSIPRRQKLEVMHDGSAQFNFMLEAKASDLALESTDDDPYSWTVGVSGKATYTKQNSPLTIEVKLLPAALLATLNGEDVNSELKNGRLEISGPLFRANVDAATGRPLEIKFSDPDTDSHMRIFTDPDALSAEQRRIDQHLEGGESYDAASPLQSTVAFVFDEWMWSLQHQEAGSPEVEKVKQRIASLRALRKLVSAWHKSTVAADEETVPAEQKKTEFQVPGVKSNVDLYDIFSDDRKARRQEIGALLGMIRRSAPKDGSLWPICRSALIGFVEYEPFPTVDHFLDTSNPGPISYWLLASLGIDKAPDKGIAANTLDGFRADYRPFLSGDSPLSELVRSLADAARNLSEKERRDISYLASDPALQKSLADALLTLSDNPERGINESLADSLELFWSQYLRSLLRHTFQRQIVVADIARTARGKGVKSAAPAFETPISQQLKGLDALEQELGNLSKPERLPPLVPADTPTKPD